jgi:uncharacterized small protein (DUF1192 family)
MVIAGVTLGVAAGASGAIRADEDRAAAPPASRPGAEDRQAGPESERASLERRIAALEAAIAALRAEIERLRAGEAGRGAAVTGSDAAIREMEARVEALAQEIERLRIGEAAAPEAAATVPGLGPAASKVYRVRRGFSIGGYGEMLYQNFDRRRDDGAASGKTDEADFLRAVFYFGHKFSDRILFNSEIEFEHAQAGEGKAGEVSVEFAYLDFKAAKGFGIRGGLLLVPIGFLNELHEPPIFHGAQRPQVERVIIPTTWRENGVGVYGDAGPVTYRAYLVTSLKAVCSPPSSGCGFSAGVIRGGRQSGARALAKDLAVTARVDYAPVPGLLLGASVFTGETGQGSAAAQDARLTLYDAHLEWNWRALHLRGLYARGILSDAEGVSLGAGIAPGGSGVGSRTAGWYGEVAWNLLHPLEGSEQELWPFVRYEAFDTQAEVAPGFTRSMANDQTVRTYGLTYRPIPNIAVKVDYQGFRNRAGTGVDQVNFALGYLF